MAARGTNGKAVCALNRDKGIVQVQGL